MRHLIITILLALIATGCAHTATNAAKQDTDTSTATITYEPTKDRENQLSKIPGIEEVATSRWGAKYTIFVSPQWTNPMVFEIVPTGNNTEEKVRIPASTQGSFAITAKTNPSRTIITYQGEDGARHRLCTMRGVEVYINLRTTGFGLDGVACEFMKVFLRSDWENNIAAK